MTKFAAAPVECKVETHTWKCPHCEGFSPTNCPYCGGTGKKSQRVAKHDPRCGRWSGKACTGGLR